MHTIERGKVLINNLSSYLKRRVNEEQTDPQSKQRKGNRGQSEERGVVETGQRVSQWIMANVRIPEMPGMPGEFLLEIEIT